MTLSALIKKGGLSKTATATPATTATQESDQQVTVAPVATVAVAAKPEPLPELSPDEEASIRAWLAHIKETDSVIIAEVLEKCHDEFDARVYFLKRSKEVPEAIIPHTPKTCGDCIHFERIDHPNLGHCAKGERKPSPVYGTVTGVFATNFLHVQNNLLASKPIPGKTNMELKLPIDFGKIWR